MPVFQEAQTLTLQRVATQCVGVPARYTCLVAIDFYECFAVKYPCEILVGCCYTYRVGD